MGDFLESFRFRRIGGLFDSVDEFLKYFSSLSSEEKERFLFDVYCRYGKSSEEFLGAIQCFVFWALNRYFSDVEVDENEKRDVVSDCILRVLEKIDFYDRAKGSFLSFLHSIVRDAISRRKYSLIAGAKRDVFYQSFVDESGDSGVVEKFFIGGRVDTGGVEEDVVLLKLVECDFGGGDSVYFRKYFWDVMKDVYFCGREEERGMVLLKEGSEKRRKKIVFTKRVCYESEGKLYLKFNRSVLILVVLALLMKIDLRILLYLYEKYKEDVFFMFFMFMEMKVQFPSAKRLMKVIDVVDEYLSTGKVEAGKVGRCLSKVLEYREGVNKIVLSLDDERFFRLGRFGVILGGEDSEEDSEKV
ncbi:MAG: hypothetical protein QXT86_12785 [Archaeoglobaceae archaeon]